MRVHSFCDIEQSILMPGVRVGRGARPTEAGLLLVPHAEAFYLTWLFFIGLGIGAIVNKLTLGDSGPC